MARQLTFKEFKDFERNVIALQVTVLFSGQRAINYCTEKLNPVAAIANAKIIDAKEDMILAANSLSVVEVKRVANTLIRRIK